MMKIRWPEVYVVNQHKEQAYTLMLQLDIASAMCRFVSNADTCTRGHSSPVTGKY